MTVSAEQEMGKGDDRTGGGQFGMVTIWAGTTSATWTVTTISDDDALADGTVVGRIEAGTVYTVGAPSEVTVALLDDDGVVPQGDEDSVVTDPATPGVDAALVAEVTALADGHSNPEAAARLRRVVKGMTGEDGGYTAQECREAATRHGVLSTWKPWCDEIARREAHTPPVPQQQQVVTLPAVSVSAGADVTEGGDAVFTVTANPAPASPLSVTVTVATAGDYGVTAGSRSVTIPTAGSATLTLATANDDADEADGSVSVTVAAGDGYTVGDPASGSVAIADDDPAPSVATVDAALVAEVTALADGHSNPEAAARLRRIVKGMTGEDGGYTTEECRETATRHGVLSTWKPWCDEIARREAHTPPEPEQQQQQQVITLPAVSVSAGADVTEGGDAVFTVTASPAPASALSVTVTVAAEGEFGVTAGSQSVTIPTTGSAALTLATANDDADEPDGSVSVTVAAGNGYTVGDPASGSVSIADDDLPLPAIAVSAGDAVTEGGDATFTVTASPAPASPLAVSVTVATEGDYGITAGTRTVSIPTAGSATLTLATSDDDADEPDGSVSVTVAAGNGYTVGSPASGSVSIADDDLPPPVVSIAAKAASVTEGGAAAFTLTADRAPDADLTVTLSVAETGGRRPCGGGGRGSGHGGHREGRNGGGLLRRHGSMTTWTSRTARSRVTLKDGGGYTVPSPPGNAAAVTVSDNDAAALPSLSVADVTVKEGGVDGVHGAPVGAFGRGRFGEGVDARFDPGLGDDAGLLADLRTDRELPRGRDRTVRRGHRLRRQPRRGGGDVRVRAVGCQGRGDRRRGRGGDDYQRRRRCRRRGWRGSGARWRSRRWTGSRAAWRRTARPACRARSPGRRSPSIRPPATTPDRGEPAPAMRRTAAAVPGGTGALALADVAQAFGGQPGHSGTGGIGHDAAGFANGTQSQTMTARDALLGSSFSLTGEKDGSGGSMAFWGRAAQGGFDGREGTFSLDGTVTTGMLGADYARGKWLVGLALAQSAGGGATTATPMSLPALPRSPVPPVRRARTPELCRNAVRAGDGSVEASLTAAIPYAALQASERLKLWGAAGYGTGEVTLKTGARRQLQVRHQLEHGGGRGSGAISWLPRPRAPARRWR